MASSVGAAEQALLARLPAYPVSEVRHGLLPRVAAAIRSAVDVVLGDAALQLEGYVVPSRDGGVD